MNLPRRLRGLLGTMITWGVAGAPVGATMLMTRYQPWAVSPQYWPRFGRLLGAFLAGGALWGSACGLAFGVVVWARARRKRFDQLSSRRFLLWGAAAGAAFPLLIYTPVVLTHAGIDAIPLYGTLTAMSAVLGAGLGRAVLAMAKRAPLGTREPLALDGASVLDATQTPLATRDLVR